MRAYATYDPRKGTHVAGAGGDHPYQEIPYGDGPGPRGPIPEVPQHYAQVPPPPQRQGMCLHKDLVLSCLVAGGRTGLWPLPLAAWLSADALAPLACVPH